MKKHNTLNNPPPILGIILIIHILYFEMILQFWEEWYKFFCDWTEIDKI